MNMLIILTLLLGAAACRGPGRAQTANATADSSAQDSSMTPTTLRWRSRPIEGIAMSLAFIDDGAPPVHGDLPGIHNVSQLHGPVQLDLWVGHQATLAWWRGRFAGRDATVGAATPVEACGRSAQRQEVAVPAQQAVGLVPTDDGPAHVEDAAASEIHVAIAGISPDGQRFVASWRVERTQRAALRHDEQRYLASIQCAP